MKSHPHVKVVAYVPDLMDKSRFRTLPPEVEVTFVSRLQDFADMSADVFVADLGRPGAIEVLSGIDVERVGFISHIDEEGRKQAAAAGIRVFTRSAFFSRMVTILSPP